MTPAPGRALQMAAIVGLASPGCRVMFGAPLLMFFTCFARFGAQTCDQSQPPARHDIFAMFETELGGDVGRDHHAGERFTTHRNVCGPSPNLENSRG